MIAALTPSKKYCKALCFEGDNSTHAREDNTICKTLLHEVRPYFGKI